MTGTFIGVRFSPETINKLIKLQKAFKISDPTPHEDLHATIICSDAEIRGFVALGELEHVVGVEPSSYGWKVFRNPEKEHVCLVLAFESNFMSARHKAALAAGGTSNFPEYIPHVTLTYHCDEKLAQAAETREDFPLPRFAMEITEEYMNPLDENFGDDHSG